MAWRGMAVAFAGLVLGLMPPSDARADMPGNWAGPYAGVYAGYAFGRADATAPYDSNTGFFYNFTGSSYGFDTRGALAGVIAGHNWQRGAWVAGVEAEIGYLGLDGSAIDPNGTATGTPDTRTKIESDFHATFVGRLGAAIGGTLFYLKAGGTLLNAQASTIDPCVQPPATCGTGTLTMHGSKLMLGWTAGGGVEWAVNPRWTAKLDYAYSDFGRIETGGPSNVAGEFYRQRVDVTAHAVKIGINYRIAPPTAQ
jgi:outer membrane immunogenic protein